MVIVHGLSLKSLQESFEDRASEWGFTGITLSLGVVFMFNTWMFARETFDGIRSIVDDQQVWTLIFLVIGGTRLSVLSINGAYYRTPHLRAATAFLSAAIWFAFCLGFVRNGSIMAAIMPWIFLLDCYNAKRAAREAGKSEYIQRYRAKKQQEELNAGRGVYNA